MHIYKLCVVHEQQFCSMICSVRCTKANFECEVFRYFFYEYNVWRCVEVYGVGGLSEGVEKTKEKLIIGPESLHVHEPHNSLFMCILIKHSASNRNGISTPESDNSISNFSLTVS